MEKPIKKYWQTEKAKATQKRYRQSEAGKIVQKRHRQTEKAKASQKRYLQSEKGKVAIKKYLESKKGKAAHKRNRQTEKYKIAVKRYWDSEKGNIMKKRRDISSSIRIMLKGNKQGRHWEDLVGYELNDLIKRLKKTIPKGYTWQDYLDSKLHIDHIIPVSVFNFTKPEHLDFKKCWALKNLQLLPAKENLEKHNKLDKPFQPCLGF